MKIIYVDLDGVVADFEKGRKNHPLSTITPYIEKILEIKRIKGLELFEKYSNTHLK